MTTPLSNFISALETVLQNDSQVQNNFPSFQSKKAIFSAKVPENRPLPYAKIDSPLSDPPNNRYSNKKSNPTEPVLDIRIFDEWTLSNLALNKAADSVYNALHDKPSLISDEMPQRRCMRIKCSGPTGTPAEDDYEGRVVTVSANLSDPNS